MMRRTVLPFLIHFHQRVRACFSTPASALILILFAMAALVAWPSCDPIHPDWVHQDMRGGDDLSGHNLALFLSLLWFYIWPMIPMVYARGRATAPGNGTSLSLSAAPALPVGPATRALAEAVLVLLITVIVRLSAVAMVHGSVSLSEFTNTVTGAAVFLPLLLAWGLPSPSLDLFMWRPIVVACLVVAATVSGLSSGTIGAATTGLLLSGLVLFSARFEAPRFRWGVRKARSEARSRPFRSPSRQLTRDAWFEPTQFWAPWIIATLLIIAVTIPLDADGRIGGWSFFVAIEVFICIALQPVLRPFNTNTLAEGLAGKNGIQRGDFMRTWGTLPVGREQVLRRVWCHGIATGFGMWAVIVLAIVARTWMRYGVIGLQDGEGDPIARYILPAVALVPMLAGLLVAAAIGKRLETIVSGLALVLGIHTVFLVRVVLIQIYGRGSNIADWGILAYVVLLTLAASLPPIRFLARAPEAV